MARRQSGWTQRSGWAPLWAGLTSLLVLLMLAAPSAWAALPQGNAVTDPAALLRNALPIQAPDLQELQHRLESTSDDLRAKRWPALNSTVRRCGSLLGTRNVNEIGRHHVRYRRRIRD